MRNDFAAFILTHGRPDNVKTLDTLRKCGYTGRWYMIIDNEDSRADEYRKTFGEDKVIQFDKLAVSKTFDTADLSQDRRTIVYARNASFDIAEKLGLKYFLELDDDYTEFRFRKNVNGSLKSIYCRHIDLLFDAMIDFLDCADISSVALAQTGDLIGGINSRVHKEQLARKAMNSFFCRTDRRFQFVGRINEDVNTYTSLGTRGKLFFTVAEATLNQTDTQQSGGGMTDVYLDSGTYVKSFYTVMMCPSCVHITTMGVNSRRMHHRIDWGRCTPKIISERWKKQ